MLERNNNIEKEYGRVSALLVERYDKKYDTIYFVYLPQFEYIEVNASTGEIVKSKFVCIADDTTKSGLVEYDNELDALRFALGYRDGLKE